MAAKAPLGLPPITPGLKSIIPYLQRADEIKTQEPIVAYWCAYYAAQLGIGLKTKDAPSRNVLISLLGSLEQMKSLIGQSDAVDVDAVGSAYVENFALKVFAAADNEDRSGKATRTTAKKFLAAANFLEILKTFNNTELFESNLEKIRYSKWKAAEIAKAFREGRKPAPGPPGFAEEQELANQLSGLQEQDNTDFPSAPPHHNTTSGRFSPERGFSSSPGRIKTPPFDAIQGPSPSAPYDDGWSTIVAPNASILDPDLTPSRPIPKRSNSGGSLSTPQRSPRRRAYVSDEMEGKRSPSPPLPSPKLRSPPRSPQGSKPSSPTRQGRTPSPGSEKKVHFTPSVVGGSFSSGSQPGSPTRGQAHLPSDQPPYSPPSTGSIILPPPPPPNAHTPSPPFRAYQPLRSPPSQYQPLPPPPPPPPAPARFVLTPAVILKVQKQCRLASSALDYEDAETAKRELRAALALLGE